jgi:ferredoxin
MSVEMLKIEIEKKESDRLKMKNNKYSSKNCIASGLGDCLRERYYSICEYESKPSPDEWLMARFEEGNEQERRILVKLLSNGFDIVDNQHRFEIKDREGRVILSGRIEGKIKFQGKYYPFEIKSMNPNIYAGIDTLDDFAKYSHTKKYPKQLQSYMFSENVDEGFFIITDCLGHFKIIPVYLDYNMMEQELQNCTIVMNHVWEGIPPQFTSDRSLCRKCWACKTVCFPSADFGEGVTVMDEPELALDLKRRDELDVQRKEYEAIDKRVKERLKESPGLHAICDKWEIEVTKKSQVRKATEEKTIDVTRVKIERIEDDNAKV